MKFLSTFLGLFLILNLLNADERPNVIHINVDDLGVMDVGFMGDTRYSTKNIDTLASQGMIFTNGYAPAANCAPSRACVLSGQIPMRHGVYTVGTSERGNAKTRKIIPTKNKEHVDDSNFVLTEAFKKAGYITCQIGKWHIGKDPKTQGVDINIGGSSWGSPKGYFSPYKNPHLSDGPKGEYLTDRLTDEAIKFLSENKDKKFFLYFPFYTVHTPLQGRKDLVKKYESNKNVNANYAAMIECLDANIGRLMKTVDELGLRENTIVVFTSDNGGIRKVSKQDPYRAGKGSYYEGGVRVPFSVRWPNKIKPGAKVDTPVTGLDFYPTYMDILGIKLENKILDGVSIKPLLEGTGKLKERPLFWHFPIYLQAYSPGNDGSRDPLFRTRPGSTMRLGKWKLHEYFEDGAYELYDLESDMGETKNLASSMPERVKELAAILSDWRAKNHAPVPKELNPKFDPNAGPGKKKKKK
ncbi:MAG: sulfatase [Lentisphaeraceae bacterium]|nr:sulfatase [Lentisphaeraceae bacterium]